MHSIALIADCHCADVYSKDPYKLGLQSVMQDCTLSVPPLADVDIAVVSRVLYGKHEIAGKQLSTLAYAGLCALISRSPWCSSHE